MGDTNGGVNPPKKDEIRRLGPSDIVRAAYSYLQSVIAQSQKIAEVRIEELEPIEDSRFWNIVLSYDVIGEFAFDKKREYKQFKINATTGEVIYMKIYPTKAS